VFVHPQDKKVAPVPERFMERIAAL
jgi:hypothetical protein